MNRWEGWRGFEELDAGDQIDIRCAQAMTEEKRREDRQHINRQAQNTEENLRTFHGDSVLRSTPLPAEKDGWKILCRTVE